MNIFSLESLNHIFLVQKNNTGIKIHAILIKFPTALRRAKFKFPGRQKIFTSKKWGFTKWDREEYVERRRDGSIKPDGTNVQYYPDKGPLKQWKWREQNLLA